VTGDQAGNYELQALEMMHRDGASREFKGHGVLLFTEDGKLENDNVWQKVMNWPCLPTLAEAEAWKFNAEARLLAKWSDTLATARKLDEAETQERERREAENDARTTMGTDQ
jgi:hypothetical protein